jgi:hypothetical protein
MKTFVRTLFFASILLVTTNCGTSIKVTDAWQADDIDEAREEQYLVIARVDDQAGRQRFEQEIAERLRAGGVKAVESYRQYPSLNVLLQLTEEEIDRWVAGIQNEGFNGIVLTVIKDATSETRTSSSGVGIGVGHYPGYYDNYGYFGDYFGSVYSPYGYSGAYIPVSQRTYTSETYHLESVAYDLERERNKQLIAVVTVEITDPKSAAEVAPKYADKVFAQFE